MKKSWKKILALLIGTVFSILVLEIALQIFNPFRASVRSGKIQLPVNAKYIYDNKTIPGCDPVITQTRNNLGFRGENFPSAGEFSKRLSFITIGGSTTECAYNTDGKTWTDIAGKLLQEKHPELWFNNGGLDGHSTFGHTILLNDFIIKIKPDYVMFLIGLNDMGLEKINGSDTSLFTENLNHIVKKAAAYSEICSLAMTLYRYNNAFSSEELEIKKTELKKRHEAFLKEFYKRVTALCETAKQNGIKPVLITQPALWGEAVDPATNINLADLLVEKDMTAGLFEYALDLYNQETRKAAAAAGADLIDLAVKMNHNSAYFYDACHFSNKGSEEVGRIVADGMADIVKKMEK
jgi:lysophospholipase L1-like esterase